MGSESGTRVDIHPAIVPLSYLLGTWRGQGEGGYPTINSFQYGEELRFSHSGKVNTVLNFFSFFQVMKFDFFCEFTQPVIAYNQKTWKLSSGEPMHSESGFFRPKLDGTIELVIAQSTGLLELQVVL